MGAPVLLGFCKGTFPERRTATTPVNCVTINVYGLLKENPPARTAYI